jgi:hypothetical protein
MSLPGGCEADAVAFRRREIVGHIMARWFTRRDDRETLAQMHITNLLLDINQA